MTATSTRAPTSVGAQFLERAARSGRAEAFRHPTRSGEWLSVSWGELADRASGVAAGLRWLGITGDDAIAIAASTRYEWVLADTAIALAGAVTTTVYPSTNAEDVSYILTDCSAVVVFAEDAAQVAKLRTQHGWVGAVRHVVTFESVADEDVLALSDLAELGRRYLNTDADVIERAVAAVRPDSLATIVYTSGTTGRPKGVELTHSNWLYLGQAVASEQVIRPDHLQFLWLPLSHVFGKLLLAAQYEIGFATAIDGRVDRIVDNLAAVRPTFMAAAPRIFEKIYSRVITSAPNRGAHGALFRWACALGVDSVRRSESGQPNGRWRRVQLAVADRLVFRRIRQRLGGTIEYLVSGSAALAPQIAEWFAAVGLPILEGYGLTETTGAAFVNRPGQLRIGSVGQALPGTEVRIAGDGEILLRGPGITRGYHGLPRQTAEVIDDDGWFATGDIGELDEDGYLRITDRKKDLVKTSGGKYIAPTAIESAVKAACPLVSHAVVIADGRNFASLLVTVDPDAARGLSPDAVTSTIDSAVAAVNAGLNRWETIKQVRVLPRELSVESGELTPSMKMKRAVIAKNHGSLIESIYAAATP